MLAQLVSVADVERSALQKLPKSVRDYYQSGADDEATLRRNRLAFSKFILRYRVLVDVSKLNPKTEISLSSPAGRTFRQQFAYPIGIAPTAFHRMASADGELATVRASSETGTLMICSTLSTTPLEEVASSVPSSAPLWFQLYVYKDRDVTKRLVQRAVNAGFKALVLTVDAPTMGRRRADEKNGFQLPDHLRLANFDNEKFSRTHEADVGASGFAKYSLDLFDMSLTWKDLRWLVDYSSIPVIVKGIVRADDALSALDAGAAAIIVSNHGGRQLDSAVSTIEALPEIVRAVRGRCQAWTHGGIVYVDGGIRSGTDILKAVVLGADMVFIGRPIIYGLAVGGSDGVKHVLGLLQTEFDYALRLSGCASIEEARGIKDLVVREDSVLTGSLQSHTGNIPLSKL